MIGVPDVGDMCSDAKEEAKEEARLLPWLFVTKRCLSAAGIITPLFMSRALYNFVAIGNTGLDLWGYRWTFLSDQVRWCWQMWL